MRIIIFHLLLAITIIDGYKIPLIKKRSTGKAPLIDTNGVMWYGSISVGEPATEFTVLLDTGSSDFILPSTKCSENCDGHKKYDESQSSTSSVIHTEVTILSDNREEINGNIYTDTVSMAGLTVQNQHFISATYYPVSLASSQFPPDGILGLALQEQSQIQQRPFFQSLYETGVLDAPVFGLSLKKNGASLFLGGVDLGEYQGEVTYSPVIMKDTWQIEVENIKVGGEIAIEARLSALVDSETGPIITNKENADHFYSNIPGSKRSTNYPGAYTFPCDNIPSISITISGRDFPISHSTFNLGPEEENSSDCIGALMGSGDQPDFIILGNIFLQNVYSIFDVGGSKIGFADLA